MLKNRLQSVVGIPWASRVLTVVAIGAWSLWGLGLAAPGYAGGGQGMSQAAMGAARKAAQAGKPAPSKTARQAPQWGPVEAGRRDPFKTPPPPGKGGPSVQAEETSGPLPPGKRGLAISEMRLEGIVRQGSNNSMIAVVANPANRAYFLRENDEVYDGVVSKITPDSVHFTQQFREGNGQTATREVVMQLSRGSGENR